MKLVARIMLGLLVLVVPAVAAPEDPIRIELNATEPIQTRCRLTFVIENKGDGPVESLKLDLAVFGLDGAIQRRLVTEMAPLRRAKTIVKAFEIDGECGQIGSILVNDVTACAPAAAEACLDRLVLSSRLKNIRLFK
jgi:hypothetical protein